MDVNCSDEKAEASIFLPAAAVARTPIALNTRSGSVVAQKGGTDHAGNLVPVVSCFQIGRMF